MHLYQKAIAAALMAAFGASATAAIDNSTAASGSGELFWTVIDPGGERSYTRDLGVGLGDFLTGAAAGQSWSIIGDATLNTFLAGTANVSSLVWNIGALDGIGENRYISSMVQGSALPAFTNTVVRGFNDNSDVFLANVNGFGTHVTAANGSSITAVADGLAYAGSAVWGSNFGGKATGFNNYIGISNAASLVLMKAPSTGSNTLPANVSLITFGATPYMAAFDGSALNIALTPPPPPPPPPPFNYTATGTSSATGTMAYNTGTASGQATESDSNATGERLEVYLERKGYGYSAYSSGKEGLVKTYAEAIDAGANGSSSASSAATWTDYFLIVGSQTSQNLEATALISASIDGSIEGRQSDGSASFSFAVTYNPASPCLFSCGAADSTQTIAEESRSVTGRRSIAIDTVYETEFTFRYNTPFKITASLSSYAANGGVSDFTHTGVFGLTLPEGAQLVSASGLVYGPTAPIPEPQTYAMLVAGLGLLGVFRARVQKVRIG